MAIKNKLVVTALLMSFFVMGSMQTAEAYEFAIDSFSVTKNGSPLFTDPFNDGNAPPSGPTFNGNNTPYFVDGTMGPEHSGDPGKLTLNSSGAVLFSFLDGTQFLHQRAILLTNIDQNDFSLGLKSDDILSVTGVFDLIAPSGLREGYDVMFNDGTANPPNTPNDIAMMRVIRTPTNQLMVQFAHLDFVAGTVDIIDSDPLDTSHTTISLRLEKKDAGSNAITGSYVYDNGTTFIPLDGTINIFNGENFTRAEFEAFTPAVPEPATMLLLGSGLIGLAGYGRKKFLKK